MHAYRRPPVTPRTLHAMATRHGPDGLHNLSPLSAQPPSRPASAASAHRTSHPSPRGALPSPLHSPPAPHPGNTAICVRTASSRSAGRPKRASLPRATPPIRHPPKRMSEDLNLLIDGALHPAPPAPAAGPRESRKGLCAGRCNTSALCNSKAVPATH
jgi:hypothetical protein